MRNTTRSPSPITSPIFVFSEQLPVFLNVRERPPNRQWPMGFRRNFFFIYFSLSICFCIYFSFISAHSSLFLFFQKQNKFLSNRTFGWNKWEWKIHKEFHFSTKCCNIGCIFLLFCPFSSLIVILAKICVATEKKNKNPVSSKSEPLRFGHCTSTAVCAVMLMIGRSEESAHFGSSFFFKSHPIWGALFFCCCCLLLFPSCFPWTCWLKFKP